MDVLRRGFLKGVASLATASLLVKVVDVLPPGTAGLFRDSPSDGVALWTPEAAITPMYTNASFVDPLGKPLHGIYISFARTPQGPPIIQYGLTYGGELRWCPVPGTELWVQDPTTQKVGAIVDFGVSYLPV